MKKISDRIPVKSGLAGGILACNLMLGHAQTNIIFNNLASISSTGAYAGMNNYSYYSTAFSISTAMAFTTGATTNDLTSVVLDLSGIGGGDVQIALYSATGAGGTPGTQLMVFNGNTNPISNELYTYTAPETLALQPGTKYFVVASDLGGSGYYASGPSSEGYFWEIGNTGSGGAYTSSDAGSWTSGSPYSASLEVFSGPALAAPEPGTLALAALGGVSLLVCRRKTA